MSVSEARQPAVESQRADAVEAQRIIRRLRVVELKLVGGDFRDASHFLGIERPAMQSEAMSVFPGGESVLKNPDQVLWRDTTFDTTGTNVTAQAMKKPSICLVKWCPGLDLNQEPID